MIEKKKVLYMHNASLTSQMANLIQVRAMCKAMVEAGMDVTLSLQGDSQSEQERDNAKISYKIHLRKPLIDNEKLNKYINSYAIRNTINYTKPDLIYLRDPLLLKQAISSKKPIIIELHNTQLHQGFFWLDMYWKRFLKKVTLSEQILRIVCISQALSDYWIKEGLPPEKVLTAHDGIDHKQFDNPLAIEEAREKLGLPYNIKIATYVGRLYNNRKIENILELAKKYTDTLFVIVGGPDSQAKVYQQIAEDSHLNNIMLTGQIPHENITDYLYASDILLALWSSEVRTINYCSPLKLFEYMAAGRTIVAHGFPTIKEVLKHDHNALICEPDSIDDLIDKVGEALNMSCSKTIGEIARNDAMHYYTWEKRVENIFQTVL